MAEEQWAADIDRAKSLVFLQHDDERYNTAGVL